MRMHMMYNISEDVMWSFVTLYVFPCWKLRPILSQMVNARLNLRSRMKKTICIFDKDTTRTGLFWAPRFKLSLNYYIFVLYRKVLFLFLTEFFPFFVFEEKNATSILCIDKKAGPIGPLPRVKGLTPLAGSD